MAPVSTCAFHVISLDELRRYSELASTLGKADLAEYITESADLLTMLYGRCCTDFPIRNTDSRSLLRPRDVVLGILQGCRLQAFGCVAAVELVHRMEHLQRGELPALQYVTPVPSIILLAKSLSFKKFIALIEDVCTSYAQRVQPKCSVWIQSKNMIES